MSCLFHEPEKVRIVISNGNSLIFERCSACFEKTGTQGWLPHEGLDVDSIPVIEDRRFEVPPCRRCGARGTELHHWAPRAFFHDAEMWPQDWLCRSCHTYWHQTMTSASLAEELATTS